MSLQRMRWFKFCTAVNKKERGHNRGIKQCFIVNELLLVKKEERKKVSQEQILAGM